MINLLLTLIVISLLLYLFLKWATKNHDVFEKQGIKFDKPLPLLGNIAYIFKGRGVIDRVLSVYQTYPSEKIYGHFEFFTPIYFVKSPELVKQITIKDFSHFQDHRHFLDPSSDDLFACILLTMRGERWREMRSSLSPFFTGNKIRTMLELVAKCASQLVDHVQENYDKNGLKSYKVKDIFSRYTNDVLSTCAFGIDCDSLKYPKNEVYLIGQEILKMQKPTKAIKFLLMMSAPRLSGLLRFKLVEDKLKKLFSDLIINTMETRKKERIFRPDMLELLMKLREGQELSKDHDNDNAGDGDHSDFFNGDTKHTWTDFELVAQCFVFFFAGFDTSSGVMSFIAYELAVNPDVQEKLIQEIDETNESLGGKPLTYEILHKMKYLDMVISETLRKWPPAVVTDRQCVKTYTYEDETGLKFTIDEGSVVWVPIYAFHMDPKYFPNPDKFDPERFSDENRSNIDMNAYLPFGIGPRNCIGLRFALMEIKALFFDLLLNFRMKVCQETQIPVKLTKSLFGLQLEKEIELLIEPRNDKK